MIKLLDKNGKLFIPNSAITDGIAKKYAKGDDTLCLCRYDAGDCDVARWPFKDEEGEWDRKTLRSALYDCRETGHLPSDCTEVLLPNDAVFQF